tara:strand:+ start:366 stop:650 length:285 start_codon:yes stop_codon:yes gene_type:complete
LLHLIITISLGVVSLFLLITIFYALRRINAYEEIILKISSTVELINIQLKTIDDKGSFEADDEVGFFFTELKQLGNELEQLFETEVDDASKKEA